MNTQQVRIVVVHGLDQNFTGNRETRSIIGKWEGLTEEMVAQRRQDIATIVPGKLFQFEDEHGRIVTLGEQYRSESVIYLEKPQGGGV